MPREEEPRSFDSSKVVRGSSQAHERSEEVIKVTGANILMLRQKEGRRTRENLEDPAGNGRRSRRTQGRPNDLLPSSKPEERHIFKDMHDSSDPEDPVNFMRAAPSGSSGRESSSGLILCRQAPSWC